MGSEVEILEERLKSFLGQLHSEFAILERIVHKNKNQHRRCKYFQYLLKVRRDFRLLQSAKLEELLSRCFQVISGNKPKQKINLLESLKWRKCDGKRPNFMEQLHGVARLLSEAIEPILKAAEEISILLAQSFFMGFSLTTLALLARLRVVAQQILLDVVSVFNMVTSLSQKRQSIKLTQEGIEVFREYYPINQDYATLECVWETDKFVLMERMHRGKIEGEVQELDKNDSIDEVRVQYESIEALLGDEEPDLIPKVAEVNKGANGCLIQIKEDETEPFTNPSDDKPAEDFREAEDSTATTLIPEDTLSADGGSMTPTMSATTSGPGAGPKKVAFISVKRHSPSKPTEVDLHPPKKTRREDERKEDPFFNLLAGGYLREIVSSKHCA